MIKLEKITDENHEACCLLEVSPEQKTLGVISENKDSLWEAAQDGEVARPFAIIADGKMVGFTMFAFDLKKVRPEKYGYYWLWKFMIDKNEQGNGYGKEALQEIIAYFRQEGATEITLSTKSKNEPAVSLYRRFGFVETGEMNDEETVFRLKLERNL